MTAPAALDALADRVDRYARDAIDFANAGDFDVAVRTVAYALEDMAAALRARARTQETTDVE